MRFPAAFQTLLCALVFALLLHATAAAGPGFYLAPDTSATLNVGDPARIVLKAQDPNFRDDQIQNIVMSPDAETWQVEAQWRRDYQGQPDHKVGPWHTTLRPFEVGDVTLPPLQITYTDAQGRTTDTMLTSQTLSVASVLASKNGNDLVPLRDPVLPERDLLWLWLTAGGVVLLLALIFGVLWWWDHRKHHAVAPPEPVLPPGLWALRELEKRSHLPVCRTGPAKPIFSLVSEVLRIYLGRRYGFNGIDMTTAELMRGIAVVGFEPPPPEIQRWIREFLEECDLVKFTTLEPPQDRWHRIWNDARLIVTQTTPPEELGEPPAPKPTAEPGAPAHLAIPRVKPNEPRIPEHLLSLGAPPPPPPPPSPDREPEP